MKRLLISKSIRFDLIRRKLTLGFIVFLSFCFVFGASNGKAENENNSERNKFRASLEKHLINNMHYYDSKSANVIDTIVTNGHVKKIISVDDPETPEDEEVVEEYNSPLVVGYVNAKQRRDSFFLFANTDIYYYALEKNEFVDYSQIIGNEEVSHFYQKYSDQTYKKITPASITILMLMLSLVVIVPILIMIFHNKSRGTIGFPRKQYVERSTMNTNLKQ